MESQSVEQLVFEGMVDRPVVVKSSAAMMSSDAGLIPIRQFDQRWKFTRRLAECLDDTRSDPTHAIDEMLSQRLFGIIAGYEDCNDHDDLRNDPVFKILAGRRPTGDELASQPTLSRFENSVTPAMLQRLVDFNITTGVERLQRQHGDVPDEIILDIDPTDDATHGRQQLSLFHGFYKQHQYLPQIISEPTTKHVFLAWLRPGTAHPSLGADDDLMRVVSGLRKAKAGVTIHVRGDCGFGLPKMYDVCEENELSYTFGMASNARLKVLAEDLMQRAVDGYHASGIKQRLFTRFKYQADSWPHARTVVAKAECQAAGTNLRFVVTSLNVSTDDDARQVYDDYIQRGESEQRNDELKNGLSMDRLSCHRFKANFWRLLLHVAAYNLLNAFRDSPETPTELRKAQPQTWRCRVIKVAARITESSRRIVIELSSSWPHWPLFLAVSHRSLNLNRSATGLIPAPD